MTFSKAWEACWRSSWARISIAPSLIFSFQGELIRIGMLIVAASMALGAQSVDGMKEAAKGMVESKVDKTKAKADTKVDVAKAANKVKEAIK